MEKKINKDYECIPMSDYIRRTWKLPDTDIKSYSGLTLAYIGDAIYELIIRTYIVEQGNAPVNKLHKKAVNLVKASAQAELYKNIKDMLTEEEMAIYKRGRNSKSYSSAKNVDIIEYRTATGVEALIGYLYLTGQIERMLELIGPVLLDS
ncbi:MAG: ribonuclease III [Clostridiales bacterium]|nr:ribonuclease III [Clostridiales bacterium]